MDKGQQDRPAARTEVNDLAAGVLDAVREAVIVYDNSGALLLVNRSARVGFEIADAAAEGRVVQLRRDMARKMEDPEGFMESFQELIDKPDAEIRFEAEQLVPVRRLLSVSSACIRGPRSGVLGRVDIYRDVTTAREREGELHTLYEEARQAAESYQRALLPDAPPKVPRMGFVAHYLPARRPPRGRVCGDFYDFIPMPDGAVGLLVGDVCGAGPEAASDAALCRYTARSLARRRTDPAEILDELNEAVRAQRAPERFIRAFLGVLEPERARMTYANAGHVPPAAYRRETNKVELLESEGLPLGVAADPGVRAETTQLDPGDMVLLYTDGLTEATRHGRPFGQAKLGDHLAMYGVGTPGELVQAIRRSLEAWVAPRDIRDDVVMLAAQVVPDATLEHPVREVVLPNEAERVPEIREFVATFLADIRASVDASNEILIAVGEAAANACRHGRRTGARSEVRVRCVLEDTQISVTVADDGPGFDAAAMDDPGLPERFASGGRGLYLIRALMDDVEVETSTDGTSITMRRTTG